MAKGLRLCLATVLCASLAQSLSAQVLNCGENTPKISFQGKAPAPWAIDGSTADWNTILGPLTSNPQIPYNPPPASAFNWAQDGFEPGTLRDFPSPDQDIRMLSFTHDDYNVYFYFRRLSNGSLPNSFYYFLDVDADGYMNEGEPVFHASFTNNQISALTISRYIPNTTLTETPLTVQLNVNQFNNLYVPGKGNPLGINYGNGFGAVSVNGNPMPGTLEDVFNASNIPMKEHLKKNEIFSAALTESGYGVEMAVPWRYLGFWQKGKTNNGHALKPGDIFFYKLSTKQGSGAYSASEVKDNLGNCCGGLGRSGNVAFTKKLTTTVLTPHQSFRYYLTYTNLTNASEFYEVTEVSLRNIQFYDPATASNSGIVIKLYADRNCNQKIDPGEIAAEFSHDEESSSPYDFASNSATNNLDRAVAVAPPYGKVCFIIELTLPPNLINTADVAIGPEIIDFVPLDLCDIGAGGRTINQVGTATGAVSKILLRNNQVMDQSTSGVNVYPNPSHGTLQVSLPANAGRMDITLQDNLGRNVQKWSGYSSTTLQIDNLKAGVYVLRVQNTGSGKVITRKVVVQ